MRIYILFVYLRNILSDLLVVLVNIYFAHVLALASI